jgi:hypothetical protein
MPEIPKPVAAPELMPWVRWAQESIVDLVRNAERKALSDANANSSQNSTMSMLVEKLGDVQNIMATIGTSLTLDASQTVSGTFSTARIPNLDANKITSGTITNPVNTSGDVTAAGNGTFNAAWNYDVSAVTRRAVWMDSAGRMGQTASSERFKKDIQAWTPAEQAVLAMRLVRFHWRKSVGDDKHWEYGVIAEQLHDLGLTWLVSYEDDGVTPHSVHYDRIALALMPLVQSHNARIEQIEARLAELEGKK